MHFDDPDNGADTYEVTIDFAQVLAEKPTPTDEKGDSELHLIGQIDGMDEIWLGQHEARWVHKEKKTPAGVTINGQAWDTVQHPTWKMQPALLPEVMDLQRATLSKRTGRSIVSLDYVPEVLAVCLEDHVGGSSEYDVVIRVPRFPKRHLVRINADVPDALLGAALRIYRAPEGYEAIARLAGDRCFDSRGRCFALIPPGDYLFEVLHQPTADTLVALKTGWVRISGPRDVDLHAKRVEPQLRGPDNQPMTLNELQIRSAWKTGAITWNSPQRPGTARPTVWLSLDQNYHLHAFGHADRNYAAVWKEMTTSQVEAIGLERREWISCAFHWVRGTPEARQNGVVLGFPDGHMDVTDPATARFSTNRRFFDRSYWLEFSAAARAVFQPRGYLLSATGGDDLPLGGSLRPVAAAAILEDENLGSPDAKRLWWELTLADAQNDLLDVKSSKLNWEPRLTTPENRPVKTARLLAEDVRQLGNLTDTLLAKASFRMDSRRSVSAHPEVFVKHQSSHFSTKVPPYHEWNTRTYLSKTERELSLISLTLGKPLDANRRMAINWWLNTGAVGGGYSVTMPISDYFDSRDWFGHTWAITHEMLHNFGYGHTHEMDRLDRDVQERMEQFRWYVADHPEYIPEQWANSSGL